MIRIKIPEFKYRTETVLQGIDIAFEGGVTHGIVGLNGAGKTTFFHLLTGLVKAKNAKYRIVSEPLLKSDIAFLDTDLFFYPKLTAREFLSVFPAKSDTYNEEALAALL